eukprot:NODE_5829_length_605_cov_17.813808_g5664_i0.p1 GENE.NODE_5829_length_605_cov_17.813808_g5664_i0~~NODE_5829_length_605_cov_17.813808_g5664_i0.p1  ORF type:complete len:198 (+),score=43.47 NODE_5829_length_605_cov_17.813808_g5664_i0:31-594(+)
MENFPDITGVPYTECFCEENVFHLCKRFQKHYPDVFCLFISSATEELAPGEWDSYVPIFNMKSAPFMVWDYHVVCLLNTASGPYIVDRDSVLPLPTPLLVYLQQTFYCPKRRIMHPYSDKMRFKLIPCSHYLSDFKSDRSHMLKQSTAFPEYASISEDQTNLAAYINMADTTQGRVLRLNELLELFL